MKRLTILILSFFLVFAAKAQNSTIDSLNAELSKAKTNQKRIDISAQLIKSIAENDIDSAISLGNTLILEARSIDYKWGEANALTYTAGAMMMKGEFKKVKTNLEKAENMFLSLKDSSSLQFVYSTLGRMYGTQSKYDSANYYFFKGKDILEQGKISVNLGVAYGNIAIGYMMQSKYQQALEYQQKSLDIQAALHNTVSQAYTMLNMGLTYQRMDDLTRSEKTLLEAIELAKKGGVKNVETYCYSNLASLYGIQGKWKDAYEYAIRAAELGNEIGDVSIASASYSKAAVAQAHLGRFEEAHDLIDIGMMGAEPLGQPLITAQLNESMGQVLMLRKSIAMPFHTLKRA